MAEELVRLGYRPALAGEPADVCIVHGCAVTSRASYESRQALYQFHRRYPQALSYVLAGCAAQFEGIDLAERRLVTHVLGNVEKLDIGFHLEKAALLERPHIALSDPRSYAGMVLKPIFYEHMMEDRSRAFIKIQDGCDSFCSYCIVPYTRGCRRSLPAEDVALEIRKVVTAGYSEVVLTGIHLGQWGQDFPTVQTIVDLLKFLEQGKNLPPRLRLSSLEPLECTPELIEYLKDKEWFCHHFHVPLQSGHREVLRLMGRHYDPALYAEVVQNIKASFPDAAIGADVIVGFPGETEEMFLKTYELIESLPLTYLHVFPYSPRRGTPAALLGGRLSRQEIKSRVAQLRKLGSLKKRDFMLSQVGRQLDVILESPLENGLWRATSGNYLPVRVMNYHKGMFKGGLAKIRVTEYDGDRNMLVGTPV